MGFYCPKCGDMNFHCPRCGDIEPDQVTYKREFISTEFYTIFDVDQTGELSVDLQDTITDEIERDEYFECLVCGNRVNAFFDWKISTSY